MSAGPYYFAWCDADTEFSEAVHLREDELILHFEINQIEGDFATLSIEVVNPRKGLLAPGRPLWAWFAWYDAAQNHIFPLIYGRVQGLPDDLSGETVTLTFVAKPFDYLDRKAALAASMRVLPYYDPIFVDPQYWTDADTVLEGYTKLWHINRVTHTVTASDILVGEDTPLVFGEADVFYDSVKLSLGQVPLVGVTVEATVPWTQTAAGSLVIPTGGFMGGKAGGILSSWPKAGASLGGGWFVASASAVDANNADAVETVSGSMEWQSKAETHNNGDVISRNNSWCTLPGRESEVLKYRGNREITFDAEGKELVDGKYHIIDAQIGYVDPYADPPVNRPSKLSVEWEEIIPYWVNTELTVRYEAKRERTEVVRFTLTADFQEIVTEISDNENLETITLSGNDVSQPVAGAAAPIGDPARASYFTTDRGVQSVEHLICRARALLLSRCRAVTVEFETSFPAAVPVSLRRNAQLADRRIPGGTALGKIIEYTLTGDGDSGEFVGAIKIGCSIGYGNAVAPVAGTPVYASAGYMAAGYQEYSGKIVVLPASDVGYTPPRYVVTDDGVTFPGGPFIKGNEKAADHFKLTLANLQNGPFNAEYELTVTPVTAPKQIDLEAASNG